MNEIADKTNAKGAAPGQAKSPRSFIPTDEEQIIANGAIDVIGRHKLEILSVVSD
ncbi:hypothetical protein [Rhizobium sp. L18]|uniref:hypothetical protein n=1 Tax=Rhizobium sp. L18 TaxID=2035451 RepID=UPI0015CF2ECF|nr:hypothetical protein [Rhizobium sp. L18]